ncbi:hypothetical protein BD626DRAFT_576065 [Schizophyllum amplum]|uniref:Uncharacterized protein n=1 Tax=Schizophyllum amplum TaxID=97359 RepID=A0A550BUF9_9AGAR|nr:hypothetical protein BD626DRAFT_576065 [Auriculariopsis ampla]
MFASRGDGVEEGVSIEVAVIRLRLTALRLTNPLYFALCHSVLPTSPVRKQRVEAEYRTVRQMLGYHLAKVPEVYGGCVEVGLDVVNSQFERSPTAVLRTLVDLRRKGQGFWLTHIGQMLHGNAVANDEF